MMINYKTFRVLMMAVRLALRWSDGYFHALVAGKIMTGVLFAATSPAVLALEFIPLQHTDECPG